MTTTETTPAEAQEATALVLGSDLSEVVRKAVTAQFSSFAKKLAAAALDEVLTPEVITRMQAAARDQAVAATEPQPEPEPEPEEPERKLFYPTVEAFVEGYVADLYRREVVRLGSDQKVCWCPEWHEHGEAVVRFTAMWRAMEHLRWGPDVELSQMWRDHIDYHMEKLFDPEGTFTYCGPGGHNSMSKGGLSKLPLTPAPVGAFTAEADPNDPAGFTSTRSGLLVPSSAFKLEFPEFPG